MFTVLDGHLDGLSAYFNIISILICDDYRCLSRLISIYYRLNCLSLCGYYDRIRVKLQRILVLPAQ